MATLNTKYSEARIFLIIQTMLTGTKLFFIVAYCLPYSARKTFRMSNINHSLVKPPMSTPGSPINVTFNFFFKSALLWDIWKITGMKNRLVKEKEQIKGQKMGRFEGKVNKKKKKKNKKRTRRRKRRREEEAPCILIRQY